VTREELLARLGALYNNGEYDEEMAHFRADEALIAYINDADVSAAYNKIEKWYA
jgi:hypothetical protein